MLFYLRRIILIPISLVLSFFFVLDYVNPLLYFVLMIVIALCFIPNTVKDMVLNLFKKINN